MKKLLVILIAALALSCNEENSSANNNNGWEFNNGQTSNNGQTTNNGTTSNNNGTSSNNVQTTNNGTTNNGTTNNGTTNNGTTSGTTGGTTSAVREPKEHRPTAVSCDDVRPAGGGGEPNQGACVVDADCTEGANGRCNNRRGGAHCTYDTCFTDDDCGTTVCACEGAEVSNVGNQCKLGNCQVDSDCGPSGFCSPTFGSCGNYSGNVAYYCHTPEDECIDDSDCADFGGNGGFGKPYCKFSTEVERWVCDNSQCVG